MLSQCKDAIENPGALFAQMRRRELSVSKSAILGHKNKKSCEILEELEFGKVTSHIHHWFQYPYAEAVSEESLTFCSASCCSGVRGGRPSFEAVLCPFSIIRNSPPCTEHRHLSVLMNVSWRETTHLLKTHTGQLSDLHSLRANSNYHQSFNKSGQYFYWTA